MSADRQGAAGRAGTESLRVVGEAAPTPEAIPKRHGENPVGAYRAGPRTPLRLLTGPWRVGATGSEDESNTCQVLFLLMEENKAFVASKWRFRSPRKEFDLVNGSN